MKTSHILYTSILFGASLTALQSCLDYDNPGDELSSTTVTTDTDLHQDRADSLRFKREISVEEFRSAYEALSTELSQCRTGIYNMRGGKDGGVPAAHAYQFQYNLDTDNYVQYFVTTHKDFPYSNAIITSTYNISERFNGAAHAGYNLAKTTFPTLLNNPKAYDIPEVKAIYLLYYSITAQENTDLSGPFTYNEDKNNHEDPQVYNSIEEIYTSIKTNLDSIVECLTYFEDHRSDEYKEEVYNFIRTNESDYSVQSYFYAPNMENYIRLANSLKLRMAMHISKVKPEMAREWAEEAVAGGVIEAVDQQQGVFPSVIGFSHPLLEISHTWNDTRISASFESLLMSLDHPYTHYLFQPNAKDITNLGSVSSTASQQGEVTPAGSRIVGIRSGSLVGDGQSDATNPFVCYSTFDRDVFEPSPLYFISLSEVNFLRAEGAVRGWNMGGDAETFYKEGIRYGYIEDPYFMENGWCDTYYIDNIEKYMELESPIPYVQREPQGLGPDWPSVTKIGVKWNNGDSNETKLEKIITQKYIALFPNSHEAWVDLRRTGYPRLFVVLNPEEGDGSLGRTGANNIIRRIPWASTDPIQQKYIQETGIPALGNHDDLQGTRLWWDVDGPNF